MKVIYKFCIIKEVVIKMLKNFLIAFIFSTFLLISKNIEAYILDDAKEFNGHYYKVIEFQMTWSNAKKFCESMGGHLATIESEDENNIIRELALSTEKSNYWLGGYRDSKNIWKWITGNNINNTNFWENYGKYSSNDTKLYGIIFWKENFKWRSFEDNEYNKYFFICEWEKKELAHESNW